MSQGAYTLYGFKGSGSAAVEVALERCGAAYRTVGARPGALDFLAAVVSKWSGTRAHLRDTRPQLQVALDRIERDPAVASVFGRHWPAG
jgi:hypothetical protein